jgi:pimeloyl-ACP methyl ester carboxylesterase
MARNGSNGHAQAAPPPSGVTIPPIWKESLWPVDWMVLRLSAVYYGVGVPKGDGSAVVLVPGFMGTDSYLYEMYMWLQRIGYRPYMSGIGLNAECPGRLTERLKKTMERAAFDTGKPVHLIGHSLGGIIGRRACQQRPDLAQQLIYLGSPVQAVHAHPAIVATAVAMHTALSAASLQSKDCMTDHCACGFSRAVTGAIPGGVAHASIYTRADGVVDWHDSQETDVRLNHEVGGTHIGLVFNPRAYRAIGKLLAEKPQPRRVRNEKAERVASGL